MSRFIRKEINIPDQVSFVQADGKITIKGPLGEVSRPKAPSCILIKHNDNRLQVVIVERSKFARTVSGTYWRLLQNMIAGVIEGFKENLSLVGVGYRAQLQGSKLQMQLGFSHPILYDIPQGIKVEVPAQNEIVISGIDKQVVGQTAADLRRYRPPEPYKGKGVRYKNERVALKEVKKKK